LSGLVVTPSALTGFVPGVDPQLPATTVECVPDGEVSVRRGDRVHADGGEIGRVQGVVAVPPEGEVTHVLLDEGHLWGRKRVAIPIQDVTAIDADGVTVDLTKDEIKDLPPVAEQGPA
jgi:sporulation protein YlmC with PRC-barrel domain